MKLTCQKFSSRAALTTVVSQNYFCFKPTHFRQRISWLSAQDHVIVVSGGSQAQHSPTVQPFTILINTKHDSPRCSDSRMLGGGGEADPRHHSHARVYTRRKERDRERSEGDDGKAGSVVCYPEHTHTRPATVLSATPAHTLTHDQPHCWTVGTRVAAPTTAWPRNSDERALTALVSGLSLAQIPPLDIASAALSVAATRIASHLRARSPPASLPPPLPPPPHAGSGDCSFPHLLGTNRVG